MLKIIISNFFFSFLFLYAEETRPFCILTNREGAGLFSMFSDVLALVDSYDQGIFQGIEVDFGEEGLYWVNNQGSNWWEYYCEPICLGEKKNIIKGEYCQLPNIANRYHYQSRETAHQLIKKYFQFLPKITAEVEKFTSTNFIDQYVIGVHYRGTDAPERFSYKNYVDEIFRILSDVNIDNYKIFVATDDEWFLNFLIQKFPNRVCFQQEILRSKNGQPLHFNQNYSPYLQGKEALIDCLLLSKSSHLLMSSSNLSVWAAILNPCIPVTDFSKSLPIIH